MRKIHIMPDTLASQVAAGEVVERPASVVKELIENSIDAGASRIQVDVERGGLALIKVADDGTGMCREDAILAVERHATSKLRKASDLSQLSTYGFRGEALPSIASVSRFRLVSCEMNALVGTEILVDGGKLRDVGDSGNPPGTQVEIRDLFFNVPARRKFLRAQATEFGHIEEVVRVAAIVRPEIAFTLRHGDREVIRLARTSRQIDRIADLVGLQVIEHLIEFDGHDADSNIHVAGWISEPGFSRRNRRLQYSFLNSRPIDSPVVGFALKDAYSGLIERGSFPAAFLFIEADPASIDVNVHPTKREVRFSDSRIVQRLVSTSVEHSITRKINRNIPSSDDLNPVMPQHSVDANGSGSSAVNALSGAQDVIREAYEDSNIKGISSSTGDIQRQLEVNFPSGKANPHKILGLLGGRYLVIEGDDGLVLLHRRAAHERILYEEGLKAIESKGASSQSLLVPVTVHLPAKDFEVVMENSEILTKLGLRVEAFGENTIKVDALPASCSDADPAAFVTDLTSELCEGGSRSAKRFSEKDLVAIISNRAARYSEAKSPEELNALVSRLMECDMPYCDARGRPTMIQFSAQELARRFGATSSK
jgi:DNA mismatch repair protein MutL